MSHFLLSMNFVVKTSTKCCSRSIISGVSPACSSHTQLLKQSSSPIVCS